MSPYRHVVWDWNGTLMDDAWLCVEITNGLLLSRGLAGINPERYAEVFGFPLRAYCQRIGFDLECESFESISDEFHAIYDRRRLECDLRSGARDLLAGIVFAGLGQSVLSAYGQSPLEELVAYYNLAPHFNQVAGLDNCYGEGKIERGHRHLREIGVAPDEVLLVGDTLHDAEVAHAMGAACVLLPSGHQHRLRLATAEVEIVTDLPQIADLLGIAMERV